MPDSKVSICIPAYQQPECLYKALQSVQIQAYNNYEIVITDDSQDDSVKNLLAKFNFGEKLKYYKNKSRLGSPENWNEAVKNATGEYIKILHHDDWFTSAQSLGEYVKMLDEHPESDFAFSATSIFHSNDGSFTANSPDEQKLNEIKTTPFVLFFGNYIGAPSATIYRSFIREVFDRNIKYVVDIDFYIRVLTRNPIFQYNNKTLVCTKSEASHQVTAESSNKNTQLYEYSYLYNKLRRGVYPDKRFVNFFLGMVNHYNIRSVKELRQAGEVPKPRVFIQWIMLIRDWNLLKSKIKSIFIR